MQFSPPIRGEGEGAYTSIDSIFNIRFSPRSAAPLDHPPCAVCPSVLTERRKRFRWLAPMMDGQKRCRFYRQRFILEEATSSDDPRCGFSLYSLFERIASTISLEKTSFVVRRILDEPMIHGGTLIYRTRVESNVDKESDGTRVGRKGRKRRQYNPGRSSVGQPDDTPSQL